MTRFAKLNYYERLQLRPTASQQHIEAVYREISAIYRTSAARSKESSTRSSRGKSAEIYQLISEAYRTLSVPKRRAKYDRMLMRQKLRSSMHAPRSKIPSSASSAEAARKRRVSAFRDYDRTLLSIRKIRPRTAFVVMAMRLLSQKKRRSARQAVLSSRKSTRSGRLRA